ncbi:hypothetical protein J6590_076172 [Homalodisca vitripennis]|nr:hypothetical protein J6590_076172 [Homalodisca vitripennis]
MLATPTSSQSTTPAGLHQIANSPAPQENHCYVIIAGTAAWGQDIVFQHMEYVLRTAEPFNLIVSPLPPRYELHLDSLDAYCIPRIVLNRREQLHKNYGEIHSGGSILDSSLLSIHRKNRKPLSYKKANLDFRAPVYQRRAKFSDATQVTQNI